MKPIVVFVSLIMATVAAPVAAQDSPHLSAAFAACISRAGSNIVQRDICAQRESGAQDDRLNKAYQHVMGQLASDPAAKTRLRGEERRWIEERDYTCKVNGQTVDSGCVVIKTAARADALESQITF